MRKFSYFLSLPLLLVALDAAADPLMIDFLSAKRHDVAATNFGQAFASCAAERLLPKKLYAPAGVAFATPAKIRFAYPSLVPPSFQMLLRPNDAGMTSATNAGLLSIGGTYALKNPVVVEPGVSVIGVGQMINAAPPYAVAGVSFKFKAPVLDALALVERSAGVKLQPLTEGGAPAANQKVWFTVDVESHTAWCWQRLPSGR